MWFFFLCCMEDIVDYVMKCNVEPWKTYDVGYPIVQGRYS